MGLLNSTIDLENLKSALNIGFVFTKLVFNEYKTYIYYSMINVYKVYNFELNLATMGTF